VLDRDALIVPAEEMIWQKAFIQERERFDGADIHHLLRCKGAQLDWTTSSSASASGTGRCCWCT